MTTSEQVSLGGDGDGDAKKDVTIFIDGKSYETREHELTGTQIRHLAMPPIGQA